MTAHRGKDKRRHPVIAPVPHDGLDDRGDVGDAAAPDANREPRAAGKPRREPAALQPDARLGPNVDQPTIGKILADEEHAGGKHRWKHSSSSLGAAERARADAEFGAEGAAEVRDIA